MDQPCRLAPRPRKAREEKAFAQQLFIKKTVSVKTETMC